MTERCAAAQRRRRVSALCTGRNPAGNLRCGNTSQALRASSPQGEPFPLRQRVPKPPLEGRWHGEAVTERCAAAQRRRRVSALCTGRNPAGNLRCGNTSQALRASSPQGEPSLSGDGSLSLPLRGGGTRSVTERCAAAQRRRRVSALCTGRDPVGSFRCGNGLACGQFRRIPPSRTASTMVRICSGGWTRAKRTWPSPRGPKATPGVQRRPVFSTSSRQKAPESV